MIRIEDISGQHYLVRERDIASVEEGEAGTYAVFRRDAEPIHIDEPSYNDLAAYLAQDYDEYWKEKAEEFSEMLKDEDEDTVTEKLHHYYTTPFTATVSGTLGGNAHSSNSTGHSPAMIAQWQAMRQYLEDKKEE